jgi:hypothetical protein
MVNAAREPLHGDIELDDTWVGGPQPGLRGSRQLKGRKAVLVAVAVEKRGAGTGRVRMEVIPDFSQITFTAFAKRHIAPGATIYTDGLKPFEGLRATGYRPSIARSATSNSGSSGPTTASGPSVAGLSRRIRLPPQPAQDSDGRVSDAARTRDRAWAHSRQTYSRRPGSASISDSDLTTTYGVNLKQADKHQMTSAVRGVFAVADGRESISDPEKRVSRSA